jgi:hypothetical protein
MLDGWVLDLGDGGDGIHVDFVDVFSGIYDIVFRESKACWVRVSMRVQEGFVVLEYLR